MTPGKTRPVIPLILELQIYSDIQKIEASHKLKNSKVIVKQSWDFG